MYRLIGWTIVLGLITGYIGSTGVNLRPFINTETAEYVPLVMNKIKKEAPSVISTVRGLGKDMGFFTSEKGRIAELVPYASPPPDVVPPPVPPVTKVEPSPVTPPKNPVPVKKEPARTAQKATVAHNNKDLNNFNIMFLGIEKGALQMLSVYSINEANSWKSGTVFVPPNTLVPGTRSTTIEEIFYQKGPDEVKKILEHNMEIKISYYIKVDRDIMNQVEPYIDPIVIDGKTVNLAHLFTMEITPKDEVILASLLKSLTKPSIYFGLLPRLVWTCKQYLETDFNLNWSNLWVHYQIAKNIDTTSVTKQVLDGHGEIRKAKEIWIPTQEAWWNTVFRVTH